MSDKKGIVASIIPVASWAFSNSLVKLVFAEVGPMTIAAFRMLVAVGFMVTWIPFIRGRLKFRNLSRKDVAEMLVMGAVGVAMNQCFFFYGLMKTTALNVGILANFIPIFVAILAAIFLREKLRPRKILGIFLAFMGSIFVITNFDLQKIQSMGITGDVLILLAMFFSAVYVILGKPMFVRHDPIAVAFVTLSVSLPFIMVPALLTEDLTVLARLQPQSLLILLYLGVVSTSVAYALWGIGIGRLGASNSVVFVFLNPVLSAIFANLILGEYLTIGTAIGAGIIMAGLYIVQRS